MKYVEQLREKGVDKTINWLEDHLKFKGKQNSGFTKVNDYEIM